MRLNRTLVGQQVRLMMAKLSRDQHIDIPMSFRGKVTQDVERIVFQYIDQLGDIEESARRVMVDTRVDPDSQAFRNAVAMIAEKQEFPLQDAGLRHLNREIQAYLWNSDHVEEIFSDEEDLFQCIRPFLLAMMK